MKDTEKCSFYKPYLNSFHRKNGSSTNDNSMTLSKATLPNNTGHEDGNICGIREQENFSHDTQNYRGLRKKNQ